MASRVASVNAAIKKIKRRGPRLLFVLGKNVITLSVANSRDLRVRRCLRFFNHRNFFD